MLIKQLSVFVENKKGRLSEITEVLAKNQINMDALSIADTTDFGILRVIVNEPEKAEAALKEAGMTVKCTEVIAVSVDDTPGALHGALDVLTRADISIEYVYAFMGKSRPDALVILRVDRPQEAVKVLKDGGVRVITAQDVYRL